MQVRSLISDFAVFSAIVMMVMLDFFVGLPTPKLVVPNEFTVSRVPYEIFTVCFLQLILCRSQTNKLIVYSSNDFENNSSFKQLRSDKFSVDALDIMSIYLFI